VRMLIFLFEDSLLDKKNDRIKVHSVALNPVDPLYVAHPTDKPGRVVGSDVAGTVDKLGKNVTECAVGDKVAGLLQGGEFDVVHTMESHPLRRWHLSYVWQFSTRKFRRVCYS